MISQNIFFKIIQGLLDKSNNLNKIILIQSVIFNQKHNEQIQINYWILENIIIYLINILKKRNEKKKRKNE